MTNNKFILWIFSVRGVNKSVRKARRDVVLAEGKITEYISKKTGDEQNSCFVVNPDTFASLFGIPVFLRCPKLGGNIDCCNGCECYEKRKQYETAIETLARCKRKRRGVLGLHHR